MNENNTAIKDARSLGLPKMLLLGLQHMFAMFGASVLVPFLFGISPAIVLLMNGVGTLLFISVCFSLPSSFFSKAPDRPPDGHSH